MKCNTKAFQRMVYMSIFNIKGGIINGQKNLKLGKIISKGVKRYWIKCDTTGIIIGW